MGEPHRAAVKQHVEAVLLLALGAVAAGVARPARVHRDPHAGLDGRDLGADARHHAGDLVTEDHRLLQPHRAEAAVVIVVQVGAADAAGLDTDLHLV
jgi:predicted secreted protein